MNRYWKLSIGFGSLALIFLSANVLYYLSLPYELGDDNWPWLSNITSVVTIIGGLTSAITAAIQIRLAIRADKRDQERYEDEIRK